MTIWNANGVASVAAGAVLVTTTADFRAAGIDVGAALQFPLDTRLYQIAAIDERNSRLTIEPAYQGTTKVDQPFWVVPMLGVTRGAERTIRQVADRFDAALAGDPLDLTRGRIALIGDAGQHGQPILLGPENNLNEVVTFGDYVWGSGAIPANSPLQNSCLMTVRPGLGRAVVQEVTRHTSVTTSASKWYRNVFLETEGDAFAASAWFPMQHGGNVLGTVTVSNGVSVGAQLERASGASPSIEAAGAGDLGSFYWSYQKRQDYSLSMTLVARIDCTTVANQQFVYPINFVTGGTVFVAGASHAAATPNAAVHLSNIQTLYALNSNLVVRLKVAGTNPGSVDDTNILRIRLDGQWRV